MPIKIRIGHIFLCQPFPFVHWDVCGGAAHKDARDQGITMCERGAQSEAHSPTQKKKKGSLRFWLPGCSRDTSDEGSTFTDDSAHPRFSLSHFMKTIQTLRFQGLLGFDLSLEVTPSSLDFWHSAHCWSWAATLVIDAWIVICFPGLENKASGAEESFDSALFPFTSPQLPDVVERRRQAGVSAAWLICLGLALTRLATRAKRCSWISVRPRMHVYDILCARAKPVHASCLESWKPLFFSFFLFFFCSSAFLPRCLAPARGSTCQWWLSASKHCLKVKKHAWRRMRRSEKCLKSHPSVCLSSCPPVCVDGWFCQWNLYWWVSGFLHSCPSGGRVGVGGWEWGVQAVDRDLWADSVRLQAQQQSPCLCLSAHRGRERNWQKESKREGG